MDTTARTSNEWKAITPEEIALDARNRNGSQPAETALTKESPEVVKAFRGVMGRLRGMFKRSPNGKVEIQPADKFQAAVQEMPLWKNPEQNGTEEAEDLKGKLEQLKESYKVWESDEQHIWEKMRSDLGNPERTQSWNNVYQAWGEKRQRELAELIKQVGGGKIDIYHQQIWEEAQKAKEAAEIDKLEEEIKGKEGVAEPEGEEIPEVEAEKVAKTFKERLSKINIFGRTLKEYVMEEGTGFAVGVAIRNGARMFSWGTGSWIALAGVGMGAGAAIAGIKEFLKQQKAYNSFIEDLKKDNLGKFDIGEIRSGKLVRMIYGLESRLLVETDSKKREALSDQIRYFGVYLKKKGWEQRVVGPVEPKSKEAVLDEFISSYDIYMGGIFRDEKIQKERQSEKDRLKKEIQSAALIDKKMMFHACLKGAVAGGIGAVAGGLLADWAVDHVDEAREWASQQFGWGGGGGSPDIVQAMDSGDQLAGGDWNDWGSGHTGDGGLADGGGGDNGGGFDGDSGSDGGLTDGGGEGPTGPVEISLEDKLAAMPSEVDMPAGSDSWQESSKYLKELLGRDPSKAEIIALDQAVARASGISVPEWGITGSVLDTQLPAGFKLNFDDSVKNIITRMITK